MSALPDLTRLGFARGNMPFGSNNTTQIKIESYWFWLLQAVLRGIFSPGTTGGTRNAASIWICRGSSNGVTGAAVTAVGVAGVDNWGGATFPGDLTRGNNSTSHHWMLLECVALGYELLLNVTSNAGYITFSIGKTGCFTGGTPSACPVPTSSVHSVQAGQTGYSATDGGQYSFFGDTTNFGNTMYGHITIAPTGEFIFFMTRAGLGTAFNIAGVWASSGAQAGDTNNMFVLTGDTTSTSRGAMSASRIATAAFCASRQPNGQQKSNGGTVVGFVASTTIFGGQGVDVISAQYNAAALPVVELTPQYVFRGELIDLHIISDCPVLASVPTSAAQERLVLGNLIIPFPEVVPLY